MNEIYWMVVIGNLHNVILAIFVALVLVLVMSFLLYMFSETDTTEEKEKEEFLRFSKKLYLAVICISIILCFLPSKKDLLAIYGIGGTIDYIKSNDKAKELPDKVVDALTEYLDNNAKDQDDGSK